MTGDPQDPRTLDPVPVELPALPLTIVPGINDSGPGHWQSLWQRHHPAAARIRPRSFVRPELDDWIRAIDDAVESSPGAPLLVAHSLGCLAAAAWAMVTDVGGRVAGLFLVAVPDPNGPRFPVEAATFRGVQLQPLPVPGTVVISPDDPYGSLDHGQEVAARLGARPRVVPPLGHLNEASGLGVWPAGQQLLRELVSAPR